MSVKNYLKFSTVLLNLLEMSQFYFMHYNNAYILLVWIGSDHMLYLLCIKIPWNEFFDKYKLGLWDEDKDCYG